MYFFSLFFIAFECIIIIYNWIDARLHQRFHDTRTLRHTRSTPLTHYVYSGGNGCGSWLMWKPTKCTKRVWSYTPNIWLSGYKCMYVCMRGIANRKSSPIKRKRSNVINSFACSLYSLYKLITYSSYSLDWCWYTEWQGI